MLRLFMILAAALFALLILALTPVFTNLAHATGISTGLLHLAVFVLLCYLFSRVK